MQKTERRKLWRWRVQKWEQVRQEVEDTSQKFTPRSMRSCWALLKMNGSSLSMDTQMALEFMTLSEERPAISVGKSLNRIARISYLCNFGGVARNDCPCYNLWNPLLSSRQKTMGQRTRCSSCDSLHGQFCGDCLYMRWTKTLWILFCNLVMNLARNISGENTSVLLFYIAKSILYNFPWGSPDWTIWHAAAFWEIYCRSYIAIEDL